MKKLILAGSAMAALAFPLAASASAPISTPVGSEGCAVGPNDTCTYVPTSAGGFVGGGQFTITLYQGTKAVAQLGPQSKQGCAQWTNGSSGAVYTNITSVTVATTAGAVAAGDPFPTALQSAGSGQTAC